LMIWNTLRVKMSASNAYWIHRSFIGGSFFVIVFTKCCRGYLIVENDTFGEKIFSRTLIREKYGAKVLSRTRIREKVRYGEMSLCSISLYRAAGWLNPFGQCKHWASRTSLTRGPLYNI
jgi:hypothetical protein